MKRVDPLKLAKALSEDLVRMDAEREALVDSRNHAIRQAYAKGETIAELKRATGLSRTILYRILEPKK